MPGIVGLITKMGREWAEPQLQRMVESVRHEAFYVSGVSIDESLGVYAGWVERRGSFSLTCRSATSVAMCISCFLVKSFLSRVFPAGSKREDTTSARRKHLILFIFAKKIRSFQRA